MKRISKKNLISFFAIAGGVIGLLVILALFIWFFTDLYLIIAGILFVVAIALGIFYRKGD